MFVIPLFMTLANVAEKAPMLIELGTNISQTPMQISDAIKRCPQGEIGKGRRDMRGQTNLAQFKETIKVGGYNLRYTGLT